MKTELLCFDDDPRKGLEEKVQRAATHCERKCGHPPNLCYVHPSALSADRQALVNNGIDQNKRKAPVNKAQP